MEHASRRPPIRHRRTRIATLVGILILAGAGPLGFAADAGASCNLIPVAERRYASDVGGVVSPITAPGETVKILLGNCDASPGFEPIAANNSVTLTFRPPGIGPDTDVSITLADNLAVSDCSLLGGRCRILSFDTPSTLALLPPHGLAGPARIVVEDTLFAVVAEIETLSIPTTGCDASPDTVFRQFTVLPPANLVADLVSGTAPYIRATVDGGGNLLVPLDHWGGGGASSVLASTPGASVAILLDGSADIPALHAGDPNTILDVLAAQPNPERWVRSFTLNGRPLPPLIRLTAAGELFGTADAVASALRFQRNDGLGGPDLYNLSDRLYLDKGPVIINTYTVARRDPLPLVSLRAASGAVGYTRYEAFEGVNLNPDPDTDDYVVQVLDVATGVGSSTGRAVAFVGEAAMRTPAMVSSEDLVAFLESEANQSFDYNGDGDQGDSILRVYRGNGAELSAAFDIEADTGPLIDRRTLGISGERVFFRTPASTFQTLLDNVGGVDGLDAATDIVVSPDGLHVYTAARFDGGVGIYSRNAGTGVLSFVALQPVPVPSRLENLAISPDGKHVYVYSWDPGNALSVYSRNALTGLLALVETKIDGVGGVDGLRGSGDVEVSPDGANVYVAGGGGFAGFDEEIAVFQRNAATGQLTFVEAEPNVLGAEAIAFSPDGAHLYVTLLFSVKVFERDPGNGALTLVQTVSTDNPRCLAVSADGRHVYVGGGFPEDIVLFARDVGTGLLSYVTGIELPIDPDNTGGISQSATTWMAFSAAESRVYADATRPLVLERDVNSGLLETVEVLPFQSAKPAVAPDGRHVYWADWSNDKLSAYRPDVGLGVFDTGAGALRSFGIPATRVAVAGQRALFLRPEDVDGSLLSGDGDAQDFAAQLLDSSGPVDVVTPLGVAARNVALSDDLIALVVPEGSNGNADRNGDGDTDDIVLAVADVSDPANVRHVGVAADAIAVSGTTVVFSRPEWMEKPNAKGCKPTVPAGGCDLNGNGMATDRVVQVYRHKVGGVGTVENVGWQVGPGDPAIGFNELYPNRPETVAAASVAVFLTDEPAAGIDLNGDFDTDDLGIVQFLNLANPGGAPINTGLPGFPCNFPSCEPALPYRVDPVRNTVSFIVWEAVAGVDLNGNFSVLDFILNVYNLETGEPQRIPLHEFPEPTMLSRLPEQFLEGQIVYSLMSEFEAGVDLNGDGVITGALAVVLSADSDDDGVFDDFDTCIEIANATDIDGDEDRLGDFTCDPDPRACPPAPLSGCTQITVPGKGALQIKDNGDDTKDRIGWRWNAGDATALADLGDPVNGFAHYSLCVYDAGGAPQPAFGGLVRPRLLCDPAKGKKCWSKAGKTGFKMKDKAGGEDGMTQMRVASGIAGKAKMQAKGKGIELDLPTLPLAFPLTTQMVVRDGGRVGCWEATFSAFKKNDGSNVKAKSD